MTNAGPLTVALSAPEMEMVRKIAAMHGISEDEAATRLVQSALARRVRRGTGKAPAKVYALRGKP